MHKQLPLPALPEDDFKQKTSERLDVLAFKTKVITRDRAFFLYGASTLCHFHKSSFTTITAGNFLFS